MDASLGDVKLLYCSYAYILHEHGNAVSAIVQLLMEFS